MTISRLASVTWVGGATGNWSTASNWAGGAIPDYANVEAVVIPAGVTVTYDSGVPGITSLSKLTDSGNLIMTAGELTTTGNLSTNGYQQTGGTVDVGGTLSIKSPSGTVTLGDITAGELQVTSRGGAITQIASSTVEVSGTTSLTADNGLTGTNAVDYGITLADAGNQFAGSIAATGSNIDLLQSTGALILGATTATGALTVDALDGAITQLASAPIKVTGNTSLNADGFGITLTGTKDKFVGSVAAEGSTIALDDVTALTANLTSTGAVSLTSAGALHVSGTIGTSLTTMTTGAKHATTFGATTVGTTLNVSSTGAVTETSSNVLTVAGEGTTTVSNPDVTVNGVVGAEIPAP